MSFDFRVVNDRGREVVSIIESPLKPNESQRDRLERMAVVFQATIDAKKRLEQTSAGAAYNHCMVVSGLQQVIAQLQARLGLESNKFTKENERNQQKILQLEEANKKLTAAAADYTQKIVKGGEKIGDLEQEVERLANLLKLQGQSLSRMDKELEESRNKLRTLTQGAGTSDDLNTQIRRLQERLSFLETYLTRQNAQYRASFSPSPSQTNIRLSPVLTSDREGAVSAVTPPSNASLRGGYERRATPYMISVGVQTENANEH